MDVGKVIKADILLPGKLIDMVMYPLISTAQMSTLLYVNFTSTHDLYDKSKIEIKLPDGLVLPAIDTTLELIGLPTATSGTAESTYATTAKVISA